MTMHSQKTARGIERVTVVRVSDGTRNAAEDFVAAESPLTIVLDNQELVTILCTPVNQKYLAVGFLFSEGFLRSKEEIKKVVLDDRKGLVWVETMGGGQVDAERLHKRLITSGCGRGASFYSFSDTPERNNVESQVQVSSDDVFRLVKAFQHHSEIYRTTHGVHSAALCDDRSMLVFAEDIGRHNALDKVFGECILNDVTMHDRMIIVSGRISSEMLLKVARRNIPVVISVAAPTSTGVKMANDLGITLIGLVRGSRMNVYSGAGRVVD
jgi:FdhD protein